jgi:hypothetical protein
VPESNIEIIWTLKFEWYVVGVIVRTDTKKDMCLKEIGLRAQYMITILGSTFNMIGVIFEHVMNTRIIFTLVLEKIFI